MKAITKTNIIDNNLFLRLVSPIFFSMNSPIAETPAPIQIEKAKKLQIQLMNDFDNGKIEAVKTYEPNEAIGSK